MRNQVERLRIWLVVGAGLLVLVVAGFLGYARYRSRAFLAGLPGRLGVEISREANGYTLSRSTKEGRTEFTLHAAKMQQMKDGLVKLHDVSVVVYGRQQDRADRIYGKEFEYYPAAGIVRALGEVHLDLQAPTPTDGKKQRAVSAVEGAPEAIDAKMIHITTSGLVYLTKLEVAATSEDVEFTEGAMSGRAHGAEIHHDTGMIVLQSAVRVNGLTNSGPMVLTASRAEMFQSEEVVNLTAAKVAMPDQTVEAERAVVHVRKDGSPERVEGSGRVVIARAAGGTVTSGKAEIALNAESKPQNAHFGDGVRFAEDEEARHAQGQAAEARVRFDGAGQPEHMTMLGGVTMQERERGAASEVWSTRVLTGSTVEVGLGQAAGAGRRSKTEVRDAEAMGGARFVVVDEGVAGTKGHGPTRMELAGDDLKARFVGGRQVSNVLAAGHTEMHHVDALGVEERSSGDTTELVFRTAPGGRRQVQSKGTADSAGGGLGELASAVQDGHVVTVRKSMRAQGKAVIPVEERATAERAVFDGDANRVTLTGGVMLTNVGSTLWGNRVVVERGSGDATAEGGVRVTYLQSANGGKEGEPVHLLADHGDLKRGAAAAAHGIAKSGAADRAFFYGVPGKPARMWQGSSQVEAPVLEFEQEAKRLTATGPGAGMPVHAVLVAAPDTGKGRGQAAVRPVSRTEGRPQAQGGPVRIASHEMVYTDGLREVVFTGGVLVEDADGRMKAQRATVYLQAAGAGTAKADSPAALPDDNPGGPGEMGGSGDRKGGGAGFPGGNVDHIVATGKIELDQPGRHGTGEQLVYTTNDGMFVLTGRPGAPPRLEDEDRGTTTGVSLRFHAGDDSVVVTGSGIQGGAGNPQGAGSEQVRTRTRVKQ